LSISDADFSEERVRENEPIVIAANLN
jgi:hypothetical protein